LDQSETAQAWHGDVRIRMDAPNGAPAEGFEGASLEVDWISISDNALFTPAEPLCTGGRLWPFSEDRTAPLSKPSGIKGLNGPDRADIVGLGCQSEKLNMLQKNALNLALNPSATWSVDEFDVGINQTWLNGLIDTIDYFSGNDVVSYIVFLNSIEDYWLDEGTADQRFNPVRNPLSVASPPNTFSVAHNVMDPMGIAHYRGTMEVLANTFSDPSGEQGQIYGFIIGNELDAHYSWYNLGDIEMEKVVDIYLTSCRMADLALRKYNPDFRVFVSFTHFWNKAHLADPLRAGKPKEFLELFAAKAEAEGDFPWGVCIHPYSVSLFNSEFWNDSAPTDDFNTEYITFKNLQVIRRYLQQSDMLYNGQPRPIILGEQGFHVAVDGDAEDEATQAAALAYSFKITEQIPDIEAYLYHRQLDHSLEGNLRFGLGVDQDGLAPWTYARKRPSWQVMHDYGTASEAATFNPYLSYLPIGAWADINLADIKLDYPFNAANPDIAPDQITSFQIANGVCSGTATGNDPKVVNPNVNTYGDGQETGILRIKTERTGDWQLFWGKNGGGFNAAQSVTFPVAASTGFQTYSFDLSADVNWVGQNITSWRLDPIGTTSGNYDFEIDYLVFGPAGDFDGDGIPDAEETLADLDGDGVPNLADLDSNGDGTSDFREKQLGLNPLSTDSDADGIPSDWERLHGSNPYETADAGMDVDQDGFTYLDEYVAVTDPNNGLDYFQISGTSAGTNIYVDGKAGRTYTLIRSSNLSPDMWNPVAAQGPLSNDGTVTLVDETIQSNGFYRVEVSE
ncbi:MAG: DUF5722 domain-containing protein, partial [Verrucomicrobiota bacterium]|nr:DUF5722 domain-containing protein [Verrucomicrobiota bacterium]